MADTTLRAAPADIDARRSRALMAGGIGLAACALGFVVDRDHFFRAWLIAYLLFLGIALGSMALLMIQHLSGGAWGVFRRVFEASSRTLPLMALLFLPIVLGMGTLYPWTHADLVAAGRGAAAQGGLPEHRLLPGPRALSTSPAGSSSPGRSRACRAGRTRAT